MGRPKLSTGEKRQQTNFRLDPDDKNNLERLAAKQKVTVPAMAESLVKMGMSFFQHPMMSQELMGVFVEIMNEMQEMQKRNDGKPWQRDLLTWTACKMVFAKGPFARRNPDSWIQDEKIGELWDRLTAIRQRKSKAISLLDEMGVNVSDNQHTSHLPARGIFGTVNALARTVNHRELEEFRISQIKDEAKRAEATALFGIVKRLDAEEDEAARQWYKQIEPYRDDEEAGEQLYKDWRKEVAVMQLSRGEEIHYEDLS